MAIRPIIGYSESFSGKMADKSKLKTMWKVNDVRSSRTPSTSTKPESVSAGLWPIIRGMDGYGDFAEVYLAASSNVCGYAEIKYASGEIHIGYCAVQSNGTLKFYASEATQTGALLKYDDSKDGKILTAAFLALLYSDNDNNQLELVSHISKLRQFAEYDSDADEWDDPATCETFSKSLCIISQNMFYAAKEEYHNVSTQINQLRQNDIRNLCLKGLSVINGKPIFLDVISTVSSHTSKPTKGIFAFGEPVDSQYDRLIPDIPESYVCPNWVLKICSELMESSDFSEPTRNILLSGPAGTGKTSGARAIAYYTGRPYVKVTCSPDTDMFDMVGQMLPNVDKVDICNSFQRLGLPSIDDVANDPQGSFIKLFGHEMGPLDSDADCYREIFDHMLDYFQNSSDYTYVESNFIRAIENGWVVELQEPNVIKRNSVLVGLNGIMENDSGVASITLPTGKTIKRHRDAIVIITTNGGYDGVSPLQQSVLSRIQSTYAIEQPDIEETVKRTMKSTGFPDGIALKAMCKVMFDIQKYCKEKDITDGVCGPRELQNWAKKAMLIQKQDTPELSGSISQISIIQAAFPTLLYKVSQDEESVEEVITAVFSKVYDQNDVQSAKMLYCAGEI